MTEPNDDAATARALAFAVMTSWITDRRGPDGQIVGQYVHELMPMGPVQARPPESPSDALAALTFGNAVLGDLVALQQSIFPAVGYICAAFVLVVEEAVNRLAGTDETAERLSTLLSLIDAVDPSN